MTAGEQLLVACVKSKDSKILSLVQKKWLDGSEVVQHLFIMDYYREHGEIVGLKAFCGKFKLDSKSVDARPSYYLREVKQRYIFTVVTDKVPRIIKGVKEDPMEMLEELQAVVASLVTDSLESRDSLYSDDTSDRKKDYEERVKSKGVTYLSMGADTLDEIFYGYQKQDLITIGGRAGQGKTWLLIYLCYLLEKVLKINEISGEILFISNEMGEEEIKERLDALRFRLPYGDFLSGKLSKKEQSRYYLGLDRLKKDKSRIRIIYSCQTIDELATIIGLYQPKAIFIDGSYLMEGKMAEGWEKIVYITRNLKRLCKNFATPIINTTQLKRGTGKGGSKIASDGQDDFAYSSSYAQDSDIAIRMYQDADMKYHDLVGLEVVKGRRVKSGIKLMFENNLDIIKHSITLPLEEDYGSKEPERKTDY